MNFEIVSQVKFDTITEADITQMLKDKIAAENPSIIVNEVNFIPRQRPSRVEIEIDASFAGDTPTQLELPVDEPQKEEPVVVVDATEDEPVIVNETYDTGADDALIEAALDNQQLAELDELDSQFEQDNTSVIDEIEEQAEPTKISEMFS